MLKKTKSSQNGFAVVEVVLVSVLIVAVVAIGVVVYRGRSHLQANNQQTASGTITARPEVQTTTLTQSDVAKLQATQPTSTPAATTTAPKTTTTASSTKTSTTPASTPAVTPTPAPAPAPAPKATITISADGCMVTATGTPGMNLEVGAFTPRKGGAATFTLPASGIKTVSAGGVQGMTSYGQLTDSSGNVVAYGSSTITPSTCPAAG